MEGIFSNIYLLLGCGLDVWWPGWLVGAGDLSKYNRVIFTHEENSDRRRPQCTIHNIGSKCSKFCRFCVVLVYYIYICDWCLFILHFLPQKTWKMNINKTQKLLLFKLIFVHCEMISPARVGSSGLLCWNMESKRLSGG